MSKTLKQNLDRVMQESGFVTPDAYMSNSDQDVAQIVACAQAAAQDIAELALETLRSTWELTLTTDTAYDLPSDLLGFVPGTMYQEGRWDRADMPTTETTWALLNSVISVASLPIRVRIIGDQLHILNPQAGSTLSVEYYSNAPITASGGSTYISEFANDGDTWRLDDRLFQLETKWRFKKEKGLPDWQVDLQDAKARRDIVRSRTAGNSDIVPYLPTVTGEPYTNLWITN